MLAIIFLVAFPASPASTVKTCHTVKEYNSSLSQYGSGTVIAKDDSGFTVLTCAHVVEYKGTYGTGELSVSFKGKSYPASLVRYDPKVDLALLKVKCEDSPVSVALLAEKEDYEPGLKLSKSGHPMGGDFRESFGEARAYSSESNGHTNLIASAKSVSGDSGGGVYRVSDKRLIGVVWGGREDGLRAVRIRDVKAFIKEMK